MIIKQFVVGIIKNQPTAYNVEKVVSKLREETVYDVLICEENGDSWNDDIITADEAFEIVRKGGINE